MRSYFAKIIAAVIGGTLVVCLVVGLTLTQPWDGSSGGSGSTVSSSSSDGSSPSTGGSVLELYAESQQ